MRNVKERPIPVEVRGRGQVTIPKKLRERYHLSEGAELVIVPVGAAMLLAPRPLPLEEARRKLIRIMRDSGVTMEEMLEGIEKEREKQASKGYKKQAR